MMLDYEWGNQSYVILTPNEDGSSATTASDRQIFDHNFLPDYFLHGPGPTNTTSTDFSHHQHHFNPLPHPTSFDPRACLAASSTSSPPSMLSLDPRPGYIVVPKSEDLARTLGLNLGGRTYFSSSEATQLYRPGDLGSTVSSNSSRCQAEGCNNDLSQAKQYHRRHKVCEYHSKASTVIAAGLTQRFCQQCSRFHLLSEFDNGKRSCRKRLADHNRRRRKTQQPTQEISKSHLSLDNVARSPSDSGAQPSSSVTVAVSPPDYFRQRPYQSRSPSTTSSSLFFSSG